MGYAEVDELREEGLADPPYTDEFLERRILLATAMIDRWTGRWFEPRELTIKVDGRGAHALLLGPPIISISSIRILAQHQSPSSDEVELSSVRVYNRHLTGFLDEDDREDPRIEWLAYGSRVLDEEEVIVGRSGVWPVGTQNIEIEGVFGYTDPDVGGDDEETGVTPALIRHACMLLVIRNLAQLGDVEARDEASKASRVTSLRTRDQSISYAAPGNTSRVIGAFSGDPEIDGIIASYCRPPRLGAV